MKAAVYLLAAVFLVALLLVDEGRSWRVRMYRPNRWLWCPRYCPRVCSGQSYCGSLCRRLCKREIRLQDNEPFPSEFEEYDTDKDGHISPGEFTKPIRDGFEDTNLVSDLVDKHAEEQQDQEEFDDAAFIKMTDE